MRELMTLDQRALRASRVWHSSCKRVCFGAPRVQLLEGLRITRKLLRGKARVYSLKIAGGKMYDILLLLLFDTSWFYKYPRVDALRVGASLKRIPSIPVLPRFGARITMTGFAPLNQRRRSQRGA